MTMSLEFLYVEANSRFFDDEFFATAGDQGRLHHSVWLLPAYSYFHAAAETFQQQKLCYNAAKWRQSE